MPVPFVSWTIFSKQLQGYSSQLELLVPRLTFRDAPNATDASWGNVRFESNHPVIAGLPCKAWVPFCNQPINPIFHQEPNILLTNHDALLLFVFPVSLQRQLASKKPGLHICLVLQRHRHPKDIVEASSVPS
ncbi:hypothetical protein TNCV_4980611 [Trichonephila clavipes]|nr:hypothetical protein TNCV_4980611 [Trichonephila clavipes]